MFKHLLVPLDGSRMAESALPVASFFARRLKATVTLLHVIEKNAPSRVHGETHMTKPEMALPYLKGVSRRDFPAYMKIRCHVHTAPAKKVAESIIAHEEEFNHDLILMCTHGHGPTHRLFFGSIAQQVMGLGTKPVLITHPKQTARPNSFACRTLLVPLDDNPEHETVMHTAEALASAFKATLHLLTVVRPTSSVSGKWEAIGQFLPGTLFKMLEMVIQNEVDRLNVFKSQLKKTGIHSMIHVRKGDPSRMIVDTAQKIFADLMVLGTHGRSGLNAFWSASVVNQVCSLSRIPLLLVPVERKGRREENRPPH